MANVKVSTKDDGLYEITVCYQYFDSIPDGTVLRTQIKRDTTVLDETAIETTGASSSAGHFLQTVVRGDAGREFTVEATQDSGSAKTLINDNAKNYLIVKQLK